MNGIPIGEIGVAGIALIVVMQALQMIPKKKNGETRPTEAQRKIQQEAVDAVVSAVQNGDARVCLAIRELSQTVATESSVTRDRVFHLYESVNIGLSKVQDLHSWHAPDAEGKQTWKGITNLEDELRGHIKADAEFYTRLEARLREVHGLMKKGGTL